MVRPKRGKLIELLKKFSTHRLRRLSEWAEQEITSKQLHAQYWREHHEERYDH